MSWTRLVVGAYHYLVLLWGAFGTGFLLAQMGAL